MRASLVRLGPEIARRSIEAMRLLTRSEKPRRGPGDSRFPRLAATKSSAMTAGAARSAAGYVRRSMEMDPRSSDHAGEGPIGVIAALVILGYNPQQSVPSLLESLNRFAHVTPR
jgi:hypothetical protein